MRKIVLTILVIGIAISAYGQSPTSMQVKDLAQNMHINPAMLPSRGYFSFPVIGGVDLSLKSSLSYNDFITTEGGLKYINTDRISELAEYKNNINYVKSQIDIFNLGFYISENDFLGINLSTKVHLGTSLPYDLITLMADNSINVANKMYNLSFAPNAIGWGEIGLSYTRKIGDNFNIGLRAKYLNGFAGVIADNLELDVTKVDNAYEATGNINVNMANIPFDTDGINADGILSNLLNNPGFALDLGVQYQSDNERIRASASVSDWGSIRWNESSSKIVLANPNEIFEFDGLGEIDIINSSSLSEIDFEGILDSIATEFSTTMEIDTLNNQMISTKIPIRYSAMFEYSLDEELVHNVSAMFLGSKVYGNEFDYSISAGYSFRPLKGKIQLMTNVTYSPNAPIAVGFGAALNTKGFQLFCGTNNMLGLFDLMSMKQTSLQFAMNFMF